MASFGTGEAKAPSHIFAVHIKIVTMKKEPVKISIPELEEILEKYFSAASNINYAIKIVGHPGIGKSDVVRQITRKCNFMFIDTRLAFKENIDLGGYPVPDYDENRMIYFRPGFIPPTEVPEEFEGIVWFLDEANRAHPTVIQTLFQIITEGVCGEHQLPDKTAIVVAGNLGDEDYTSITDFDDSALDGRLALFHLMPDTATWLHWAPTENIHPALIRYLTGFPERLWDEKNIYPNPRGWHQVSNAMIMSYRLLTEEDLLVYFSGNDNSPLEKIMQSLVGRVAASDFVRQITTPRKLSTSQIMTGDQQKIKELVKGEIPPEDVLWALYGALTRLREIRLREEAAGTQMDDVDLTTLANVLKFIGFSRADMRLSFFYQLLSRCAIFSKIPEAIKTIADKEMAADLAERFQGLLEEA